MEGEDAASLFGGFAGAGAARLRARPAEPGADRRGIQRGRDPAPRLDAAALAVLRALEAEANALTLAEYAERLAERTGVRVSGATVCRALRRPVGSADISPRDRAKPDGLVRKKPPRGGAGPARAHRRAGGMARRAGPGRPRPSGLPRRERDRHPDNPGRYHRTLTDLPGSGCVLRTGVMVRRFRVTLRCRLTAYDSPHRIYLDVEVP